MNRTLLSTAAAAAGATGVLVLAPHLNPTSAGAATTDGGTTATGTTGSGLSSGSSGSSGTSSGSSGSSGTSSGSSGSKTVTGDVAEHEFGPVQVAITVKDGAITDISLAQLPSDGKSRFINSQAVPLLVSEALKAQSASIDGVSGATLTSGAFVKSLASAISKAGL